MKVLFFFLHKVTSLLANLLDGLALGTGENSFSQETVVCGALSLSVFGMTAMPVVKAVDYKKHQG